MLPWDTLPVLKLRALGTAAAGSRAASLHGASARLWAAAGGSWLLPLSVPTSWRSPTLWVLSPTGGLLRCCQFLALLIKTAASIPVLSCISTLFCVSTTLVGNKSGTAGSQGESMLSVSSFCQTDSCHGCHIRRSGLHPHVPPRIRSDPGVTLW